MTRTREDVWTLTRAEGDWPERAGRLRAGGRPAARPATRPRAADRTRSGWRFLAAMHGLAGRGRAARHEQRALEQLPARQLVLPALAPHVPAGVRADRPARPRGRRVVAAVLVRHRPRRRREGGRAAGVPRPRPARPLHRPALLPGQQRRSAARSLPVGHRRARRGPVQHARRHEHVRRRRAVDAELQRRASAGSSRTRRTAPCTSLVGNDYDQDGNPVQLGWMGSFFTAGLDPIFWLHHANIDRLWQVWLDQDPANVNPTGDPAWFDTEFSFPAVGGGLTTWTIGEVLDTDVAGLQVREHGGAVRRRAPAPPFASACRTSDWGRSPCQSQFPPQVSARRSTLPLATPRRSTCALSGAGRRRARAGHRGRAPAAGTVFLRIEGVTGTAAAPVYEVYLNVPPNESPTEHPELRAGFFSTFGLNEASQRNELHDGTGLTDGARHHRRPQRARASRAAGIPSTCRSFSPVRADASAEAPAGVRRRRVRQTCAADQIAVRRRLTDDRRRDAGTAAARRLRRLDLGLHAAHLVRRPESWVYAVAAGARSSLLPAP